MPVTSISLSENDFRDDGRATLIQVDDDWTRKFAQFWDDFADWVLRTLRGINNETLEHPYFISFALVVVWAWPHLLMLPVWFGKDAYYRMDSHAREAVQHVRTNVVPGERPRRSGFISKYRTVFNASYAPPTYSESGRAPLFGGTPLTSGDFTLEEEHKLPVALRVIRWTALAFAAFIVGRDLYLHLWV